MACVFILRQPTRALRLLDRRGLCLGRRAGRWSRCADEVACPSMVHGHDRCVILATELTLTFCVANAFCHLALTAMSWPWSSHWLRVPLPLPYHRRFASARSEVADRWHMPRRCGSHRAGAPHRVAVAGRCFITAVMVPPLKTCT